MQSITVVEYLNYVNERGEDIGHGKKVLREAVELLGDDFEVHCIASRAYCPEGCKLDCELPALNQSAEEATKSAILKQIKTALTAATTDVVWFTNVDWILLAQLGLFKPKGLKVVATLYRDYATDIAQSGSKVRHIKSALVKRGVKNLDALIVTNKALKLKDNQAFMPDYVYSDKYDAYRVDDSEKMNQVVCVGSMRSSKDLRGVIRAFSRSEMPVKIIGSFFDKKELAWLQEHATSNFTIDDRKLDDDEYYGLIAHSRYVILPYKLIDYRSATSGILQECLFLGSIPVAPKALLDANGISGIGYERIDDLADSSMWAVNDCSAPNNLDEYMEENIKKTLLASLRAVD